MKLKVSFAKEPYKRDYILQKRPMISRSLLIVATPFFLLEVSEARAYCLQKETHAHTYTHIHTHTYTHIHRICVTHVYVYGVLIQCLKNDLRGCLQTES